MWADLRSQGIRTPEIAIWQRVPQAGRPFTAANRARAIYPKVLNVYNDPRFSQVCGVQLHVPCRRPRVHEGVTSGRQVSGMSVPARLPPYLLDIAGSFKLILDLLQHSSCCEIGDSAAAAGHGCKDGVLMDAGPHEGLRHAQVPVLRPAGRPVR